MSYVFCHYIITTNLVLQETLLWAIRVDNDLYPATCTLVQYQTKDVRPLLFPSLSYMCNDNSSLNMHVQHVGI